MSRGIVVEKIAGVWTATDETGTIIAAGTPTYGIQEAVNHWAATGYPLDIYSLGKAEPFNISNETITVPAQFGGVITVHGGGWFNFDNSGTAKPGFHFDTQQDGAFLNTGGLIMYKGNWSAVRLRPVTAVQGLVWSAWHHYDFGAISSIGGTGACLYVDASQVIGADQESTSQFVDNKLYANNLVGSGSNYANLQLASLASDFQVVSENLFDIGMIANALSAEIYIGNPGGNTHDKGLGCNKYICSAISHTKAPTGFHVISNGSEGWFEVGAWGTYGTPPTVPHYVSMGPNAKDNNFLYAQKFGATGSDMTGGSTGNAFKRP